MIMKGINLETKLSLVLYFTSFLFLGGCSDSSTGVDQPAIAGSYVVESVDGETVPFVSETEPREENCYFLNNGGWIDLRADRQFQMKIFVLEKMCDGTSKGGHARVMHGTYEVSNGNVNFTPSEDDPTDSFVGELTDNGLEIGLRLTLDSNTYYLKPMEVLIAEG